MPSEPVIQLADARDAPAIAAVVNRAYLVERFFTTGDRTTVDEIRSLLTSGVFLLARRAGSVIGAVYVETRGSRAYFGMLSVDPDCQRAGVGRLLIGAAEAHARAAGCAVMDLHVVNLRTELPPYYRRLGYVESGTIAFPTSGRATGPCHCIVMSKPL